MKKESLCFHIKVLIHNTYRWHNVHNNFWVEKKWNKKIWKKERKIKDRKKAKSNKKKKQINKSFICSQLTIKIHNGPGSWCEIPPKTWSFSGCLRKCYVCVCLYGSLPGLAIFQPSFSMASFTEHNSMVILCLVWRTSFTLLADSSLLSLLPPPD